MDVEQAGSFPLPADGAYLANGLPVVQAVISRLRQLEKTHREDIRAVANLFTDIIRRGHLIHVFGAGHSHMLAEELFFRAGGLLCFNALLEPALMLHESAVAAGELERITEYASIVMDKYLLQPDDGLLVISYSGINPVPVEVALLGKARGLRVVALTSIEASRQSPARHPTGQRLYEVADLVLDNTGPLGDASLQVPGLASSVCALSTITGATILQSIVYEVTSLLHESGFVPPTLRSSNVPAGDVLNTNVISEYRHRLRHL